MLAHASNMGSQSSVSTGGGSGSNSPTPKSIGCCIRFNVKRHITGGPLGLSPSAALARPGAKAPSATGYEFANEFGNEGASAVVDGCEPGGPVQHTMYVQPVQLLQRRGKGRNMTCSVEVCANATGEPLPCISGRACEVEWKTRAFTNVVYHEKSPLMDDEIKCRLMPTADKLHLRFTFYHVSCKEKQPASLTSGGYTYISLTDTNGKFLASGEYTLPIFTNEISGTSYLDTDPATALDNAKDTFTVTIHIKSTLALQDEPLHTFLSTPLGSSDPALVLQSASSELIRFHIPITDRLFAILASPAPAPLVASPTSTSRSSSPVPGAHIHEQAVCGLIHLYNVLHAEQHSGPNGTGPISLLSDFVYHRLLPNDAHVALMDAWASILDHAAAAQAAPSPNQWAELGLDVAWAVFDSIVKSMALMRKKSKRGASAAGGGEQLDAEVASVRKLVTVVSTLVHKKALNGLTLAKDLNTSLGYFLRDLIPLLPLDFVLSLAMFHSDPIKLTDSATLATLKFDFLAIIAGSEHPIPLDYILTQTIHFIRHSVSDVRLLAASLLRDICAVREVTSGVSTPIHLYLADSIMGFLPHLTRPVGTTDTLLLRTLALCALHSMERVVSDKHLEPWVSDVLDVQDWMQRVLICLHTFQYASMDAVVDRLYLVQHRNQVGGAKKFLEEYFKSTGSAVAAMARGKGSRSSAVTTATFPSMVQHTQGADTMSQVSKVDDRSVAAELYLSHQVVLRTLKVWDMLHAQFESRGLGGLLEFLLQTTWVPMGDEGMVPVLTRIIKVVEKDPTTVLDRYLSPLVSSLLRKAASPVPPVRMAAGQVLFATFRACYKLQQKYLELPLVGMSPGQAKLRRAFVTFRIHFTVAISQFNEGGLDHIATCLDEISKRCEHVDDRQFRELMRQSSLLLSEVIRNQLKLATIPDFETRMDCYQAIANRYHNTPDLRLCTLDIMGSLYAESGHPVESGLSYLHAAALIAEHVTVQNPTYPGPKGVPAFAACNTNLVEERIADETVRRGLGEGICSSDLFSEDGLLQFLAKAVTQLTKASLYETVNEMYKLSIPIWEHRRDWPALAAAHQALAEAFSVLHNKPNRMLATYYRVGFLGALWGPELAGSQYIYRERGVCVLPEFVSKLKSSFAEFGDKFEVLQDSGKIDEAKLDPAKRYVQVTHVEPYYGDAKRYPNGPPASIFDQHQHLRTFLYMVPFTLTSGRVHGDVASQYLRQVVCTTEKSFPYMTKRLRVTSVAETELNPLQVSTQALNARCARLRQLVHQVPTDTKSLQMVLSGSLRPQVNSGPSEIARVFLTPSTAPGQSAPVCAYPASELDELRAAFRQFLRLCEVGVTLNRQLISSDQVGYQEDLEKGMRELTETLTPMIQQTVARSRQPTAEAGQGGAQVKSIMEFLGSQGDLTSFFLD
ncbi:dedicator of cytokinesis-domain-containing protein [Catenaria anguillulae PL171]|uniref:Dedicator of cytokinesis-domain-containing protein n=1 Tax=Catenaria anguillulae PL171 TaxID=765915 RepID=A0A1Y2H497_9FUNG|nr:dedicator of cytokinesis-domain-containing protein [Catenaria anguillulae PL171]